MSHLELLLDAWYSRVEPGGGEQFSQRVRAQVASLFLEQAGFADNKNAKTVPPAERDAMSAQLAELGVDEGLTTTAFHAELLICQLSLFDILTSSAIETGLQQSAGEQQGALQALATLLPRLDELILQSGDRLVKARDLSSDATLSSGNKSKQGKTLQHEIRTPLQGALLTTELMLEDAGHGDPVSMEDILAVRKSIETAVGILNDFAGHASSD